MDGLIDVQHDREAITVYRGTSSRKTRYTDVAFYRDPHYLSGMETQGTDLIAAFDRVLEERKDLLRNKGAWAKMAGLRDSTARGAFANKNPTVDTLTRLAEAAGLTLAELLEYGDPDWEIKRRAKALVRQLGDEQLQALENLLLSRLGGQRQ